MVGIYRMNRANTPKLEPVLARYGYSFIPEAHCYVKQGDRRFDFTRYSDKTEDQDPFDSLL